VREEFRERAREILQDRADLMRKRIAEFADILPINKIELGSEARLPGDYAAGHALGTSYKLDKLPDEARLRFDLQTIIRAYRALTYRGGVDANIEGQSNVADDFALTRQMSITETRKYAYHRKVERNGTAARYARKFHGNRCHVLALKLLQPLGLRHVHAAEFALPIIEGRFADPVLATQIGGLRAELVLLQNTDDLLFRKPFALHRLVLPLGPASSSTWLNWKGQCHVRPRQIVRQQWVVGSGPQLAHCC
jgi:hypothetical protein